MLIYRLCKARYSATVLSGSGGLQADGRWHSQGRPIVYCASAESLAVLELRVHVGNYLPHEPFVMHEIVLADELCVSMSAVQLPPNWNAVPHSDLSQQVGDTWLDAQKSLALQVPSIHSSTEFNVLLNPLHSKHGQIRVQRQWEYRFDARLFSLSNLPTKRARK